MLIAKLRSHVQSLRARLMERKVNAVNTKPANRTPCLDDYDLLRTLIMGYSTANYLVREKNTPHLYVLKAVNKFCRHVSTVLNERDALTKLSGSDFILPLHACFHNTEYWYLLTDYLPGGDLLELQISESLNVEAVRFYMAELLLAIEHVHAHNIIHGDIKQENVFIDTDGHIVLGDFGDSIHWPIGDIAPKTHLRYGHVAELVSSSLETLDRASGFEADLWAFGLMLYSMLTGKEVFKKDILFRNDSAWIRYLIERIKCDEPVIVDISLMTENAADLVSLLVRRDHDSRLPDITEIKNHPFFKTIDWASVASRSLTPPWVPRLISTHEVGSYHIEPTIFTGDKYTAGDDPFPRFSYRVVSSSLSRACGRRQEVFGLFEGCAPLMSLDAESSCVEEVECHSLTRRRSL